MNTFEELRAAAPQTPYRHVEVHYWQQACYDLLNQDTRPKPTRRQGECLNLIKVFIEKENIAPTIRELSDEMGLSISNIWRFVDGLIKRGYLRKVPGHSRSISIIEFPPLNNID